MNIKKYTVIGLIFLFAAAAAAWFLWPELSSTLKEELAYLEGDEETPHEHHEDKIILLSADQIRDFDIQTRNAGPGKLSSTISTRGKIVLHPDKLAHILPKVSGVAKEPRVNIGDHVREGDILAVLESREMADIKANYLAATEKEQLALSNLDRERRLSEKKISAEQEFLNAKSAYEETKINLQLAKQKLNAFGIDEKEIAQLSDEYEPDLRLYSIRSPMDGIVIARHITRGEFIEDTTTIYEIANLNTVWIEIGVYPKDIAKVKEGQVVDVTLPNDGTTSKAKMIYLSPIIQEETITARAIAEMENSNGDWRPGSFVKVSISTDNKAAPIVVSKEALQEIDGKSCIFVRTPVGFEKRLVHIGLSDNENSEILTGLNDDEEYACSQTFLLKADLGKNDVEHED